MAVANNQIISVVKGDTYSFAVSVKTSAGVNFDLTGFGFLRFTAKSDISDSDTDAAISVDGVIDATDNWKVNFTLTPADTRIEAGNYFYDIQISSDVDTVYTIVKKQAIIITDEVTQDIA